MLDDRRGKETDDAKNYAGKMHLSQPTEHRKNICDSAKT